MIITEGSQKFRSEGYVEEDVGEQAGTLFPAFIRVDQGPLEGTHSQ